MARTWFTIRNATFFTSRLATRCWVSDGLKHLSVAARAGRQAARIDMSPDTIYWLSRTLLTTTAASDILGGSEYRDQLACDISRGANGKRPTRAFARTARLDHLHYSRFGGLWPLRKYLPASKRTIAITTRISQNTMLPPVPTRIHCLCRSKQFAGDMAGSLPQPSCNRASGHAFLYESDQPDGTQWRAHR